VPLHLTIVKVNTYFLRRILLETEVPVPLHLTIVRVNTPSQFANNIFESLADDATCARSEFTGFIFAHPRSFYLLKNGGVREIRQIAEIRIKSRICSHFYASSPSP
jgi:hypothetical protein